jgi:hypothetical protein
MASRAAIYSIMMCWASTLACAGSEAEGNDSNGTETADTGDGDGDPGDGDGDDSALRPNWHEDVAPLVTEACQGCHIDGGIAPFAMLTYDQTAPWSALMADQAEDGLMPPWHALETEQCQPAQPYKHDARLSEVQIQLLRDWVDVGSPEGDPANAVPLPTPPSLDLANPTTTVTMGSPVSIEAQGNKLDFFHCLSFDPGHGEDVFLDGIQLVPGNREILHHVLIYVDQNATSATWPGGVLENCGGGSGVGGSQLISGWVPGGLPMEPPPGVGINLPAGSRLILNVHYHATGGGAEIDDSTGLALRWTTTAPEYGSFFALLGAPGAGSSLTGPFTIPAGESNHVEEFEWVVSNNGNTFPDSVEARIWAIANHMHLVGVDMRAWIEDRDTGAQTCLLHTPNWDYNWQRIYEYDVPANQGVRVKAGDIVRIQCTYDNTMNNTALAAALDEANLDAPIDVSVGEGTLDEMCLAAVGVGVKVQ